MKLEKDKNLWEESGFYWHEIEAETLKFDRRECEVQWPPIIFSSSDPKLVHNCFLREVITFSPRSNWPMKKILLQPSSRYLPLDRCVYYFQLSTSLPTYCFSHVECKQVALLRDLSQEDFKDFFNTYVRVGAPRSKSLSIQIYGARHTSEYKAVKFESQSEHVRIDDIYSFKRSRPLYSSLSGHLFGV